MSLRSRPAAAAPDPRSAPGPARSAESGLTLLEVLITLAVVVLIAGIVFPALGGVLERAQADTDARSRDALLGFAARWDNGYTSIDDGTGADAGYVIAYRDTDADGTRDVAEAVLARVAGSTADLTAAYTYLAGPSAVSSYFDRISADGAWALLVSYDANAVKTYSAYQLGTATATVIAFPAEWGLSDDLAEVRVTGIDGSWIIGRHSSTQFVYNWRTGAVADLGAGSPIPVTIAHGTVYGVADGATGDLNNPDVVFTYTLATGTRASVPSPAGLGAGQSLGASSASPLAWLGWRYLPPSASGRIYFTAVEYDPDSGAPAQVPAYFNPGSGAAVDMRTLPGLSGATGWVPVVGDTAHAVLRDGSGGYHVYTFATGTLATVPTSGLSYLRALDLTATGFYFASSDAGDTLWRYDLGTGTRTDVTASLSDGTYPLGHYAIYDLAAGTAVGETGNADWSVDVGFASRI